MNSAYTAKPVSRSRALLIVSILGIVICATFVAYGWSIGIFSSPSSSQGVPSPTESTTTSTTTTSTTSTEYPDNIEGVFYNATVQSGKVIVPLNYLREHKLVFIDVKTKEKMKISIIYEGSALPLYVCGDGQYIPIMLVMSPSGKVHGLLRFHVTDLSSDFQISFVKDFNCSFIFCSCGVAWNIETLQCEIFAECPCRGVPFLVTLPITVSEDSVSIDVGVLKVPLA